MSVGNDEVWISEINPRDYLGIVMNMEAERIPINLAQNVVRFNPFSLWEWQASYHHDHPSHQGLKSLGIEIQTVKAWTHTLTEKFPERHFVIQQDAFDQITWYQSLEGAPTHDEDEWKDFVPPRIISGSALKAAVQSVKDSSNRTEDFMAAVRALGRNEQDLCPSCNQLQEYTNERLHEQHRGVRIADCIHCGEAVVTATRIIRTLIGPPPQKARPD